MKTIILITFLFFTSISGFSQSKRDTLQSEIINAYVTNGVEYEKLKSSIKQLEKLEGKKYPEILNKSLTLMYEYNDLPYFKETIELLVANYGYNVSYLSGKENYYQSIIYGDLSSWFKKMYISNHSKWLENNLDKLVDIHALNNLIDNDQYGSNLLMSVWNSGKLDKAQLDYVKAINDKMLLDNATILTNIASKIGYMPTGNSFALIQNPYDIVEWHNFQQNFKVFFDMIYPYYKKSYINNDLSIIKFRNIDTIKFMYDKNQIFGLLSVEDIPNHLKERFNVDRIEVENIEKMKQYRKELGWE